MSDIQRTDVLNRKLKINFVISIILLLILVFGNIEFSYDSFIEDLAEEVSKLFFNTRSKDGIFMLIINVALIFGIIRLGYRQVLGYFSHKTILKELKQYLEILQLTKDEELSELLMIATVVREELLQKEIIDKSTFDAIDISYVNEQTMMLRLALTMYNNELVNNPQNVSKIAGNNVWLMTLKANTNIECMIEVKKIWKELDRGFKNLDKVVENFENTNGIFLSDWCKENLHYRPKI